MAYVNCDLTKEIHNELYKSFKDELNIDKVYLFKNYPTN